MQDAYYKKQQSAGLEKIVSMERAVALWILDSRWKEHLLIMDSLKEGIHLRGYGQIDPLVEYQKESYAAFNETMASIKEDIVDLVFKAKISLPEEAVSVFEESPKNYVHSEYSSLQKEEEVKKPVAQEQPQPPKASGPKWAEMILVRAAAVKNIKNAAGSNRNIPDIQMINLLLSAIAGIATGLSFNFSFLAFLVWISLLPFIYAIGKTSSRQAAFCAAIFGFAYYLTALFWIGNVTKLGLVLLIGYLSLYAVVFSQTSRRLLKKNFVIITVPALWVFLEFIKENVWCGFGWANLGYSQYKNLYFIQTADLFGVKLISFFIVMVNVLLWEVISRKKFLLRKIIFVLLLLSTSSAYSFFKLHDLKEISSVNLSLLQPNIPQELKWEESSQPDIVEKLESLAVKTKNDSLVIFPEASWPLMLCDLDTAPLSSFAKSIKRDILIGAITLEKGTSTT